ncbi:MAG: glycosyltransferase family 39 protein [Anaerolineae bacterium]|nr:glycosyltransferase family 39 protein [Anaerolineae bacterium]
MKRSTFQTIIILACVFIASFVVRIYHPMARPSQWLSRSHDFAAAIEAHDWAATYQQYHPGVTTMALGAATLPIYEWSESHPGPLSALIDWAAPPFATDYGREMVAIVIAMSLVLSALIVLITWQLYKLSDWLVALASASFMCFAPFYLSQCRYFHVDALFSTLMILSALLMIRHFEARKSRFLVLSGIVSGFALLTKSPALFLLPYTGLVMCVEVAIKVYGGWDDHQQRRTRWLIDEMWRGVIRPLLLWGVMVGLVYCLWPAMWVKPIRTPGAVFLLSTDKVITTHPNPTFFAGRIYSPEESPNRLFWLVALALNSSFLTLTLFLFALGSYTFWKKCWKPSLHPQYFWLLFAYLFFFLLQLTLSNKQMQRYLLPVHLVMEILAGVGLAGFITLLKNAIGEDRLMLQQALPASLAVIVTGLQIGLLIPYAPDYGAYHNQLLGGNRAALRMIEIGIGNEGMQIVGQYLADYSGADQQVGTVGLVPESLWQYFPGEIVAGMSEEDDFCLFHTAYRQRYLFPGQWESTWNEYSDREPQLLISFDGVEYLRMYAAQPAANQYPTVIVDRGWPGLFAITWIWTGGLVVGIAWALWRSQNQEQAARVDRHSFR